MLYYYYNGGVVLVFGQKRGSNEVLFVLYCITGRKVQNRSGGEWSMAYGVWIMKCTYLENKLGVISR